MEAPQLIADVHRLTDSFTPLPEAEAQPVIVMVSGLPGTGKSYFCRRLAERLPFLILESDALRKQLFPKPSYTMKESTYLFSVIYQLIEKLLEKGVPLILDATNLEERHRERLYNITERLNAKLVIVRVKAPPELVEKRLRKRVERKTYRNNSDADWAVYQNMQTAAEKIKRNHFTVDTSSDITLVIDKVVREANR